MGIHDFKVQGDSEFSKNRQLYYNKMCEGMVKELCSKYGNWDIIWFDGGAHGPAQGGPDVLSIVEKYQPNCLFYHNLQRADMRWGGSESGKVPYPCWGTFDYPAWFDKRGDAEDFKPIKYGHSDGKYYIPATADAPLRGYKGRHEWFWEPNDEAHIFPVKNLVDMYENSVGHNASLILGPTPNAEGLMPQADADTPKKFGKVISNRFNHSIAETKGEARELEIQVPDGKLFSDVVIAENIERGEKIREFSVQIYKNEQWENLLSGTCVGHKFIAHLSEPTSCKKIKLTILKSVGRASLKQFAVF